MTICKCGHPETDHALEVLTMEMPHEFGPVRARLLTYKQRRGACGLCGCEGYEPDPVREQLERELGAPPPTFIVSPEVFEELRCSLESALTTVDTDEDVETRVRPILEDYE